MPFDTQQQEQIRQIIIGELASFIKSDRFILEKHLQLFDGRNIQVGKTYGTRIGTEISQLIGFYNTAPIAQRSGAAQVAVSGTADSTYSANEVTLINDLVTLSNELRAALVAIGLIKGSA